MIISGKEISQLVKADISREVAAMVRDYGRAPHLAIVLVGHDSASETYVANKVRACTDCGITATVVRHESDVTQDELLATITRLNDDPGVDGYIVQLPLPAHIAEQDIIDAIDPRKDVDGFHPVNVGRLLQGLPCFMSPITQGIKILLERSNIATAGKHCVIIGRSNMAGKPIASMLMQKAQPGNCTVTVCHSETQNLAHITRQADILIAALGQPHFVDETMVKPGAVVIDVGTTPLPDPTSPRGWRLHGDVNFERVEPLCSAITPVPGGVGPMTVVSLLKNTLQAAKQRTQQGR